MFEKERRSSKRALKVLGKRVCCICPTGVNLRLYQTIDQKVRK